MRHNNLITRGIVLSALLTGLLACTLFAQDKASDDLQMLEEYYASFANAQVPLEKIFINYAPKVLAKAQPDEDYYGLGDPRNYYNPALTSFKATPKTNQAYVWGLTKAGNNLWFGTAPNVHCLVVGLYMGLDLPHQTDCWTCEFSQNKNNPTVPGAIKDWRPPRLFVYNTSTKQLTEKTQALTGAHLARLNTTLGIRSAGNFGGVVFFAGPALPVGVNIFAFNASTGDFINSTTLTLLPDGTVATNIRKWNIINGVLYTGIGTDKGGKVLRWTGSLADPFKFVPVGNIPGEEAAELVLHEGRIFISTWPILTSNTSTAGIWMSPVIPQGGLTGNDAAGWQKVWDASKYEPDPIVAATYGGGALASFQGYLFWGTMHVPMLAPFFHAQLANYETETDWAAVVLGAHRATSIFRGKNFGTQQQDIKLLYGMPYLPAFTPGVGWRQVPNKMGQKPLFGLQGFGNIFNNYTWAMEVYNNQLFIGTMDWSFLVTDGAKVFSKEFSALISKNKTEGADLYRIQNAMGPALPVNIDGLGNETSYGIRNMVADDYLYLGMANPMNLSPKGGWELIKMVPVGPGKNIRETSEMPAEFALSQNYPNPFNPSTTISYSLPAECRVDIKIFNTLGETVREINELQDAGSYEMTFDAGQLSSGIYIYSMKAATTDGKRNFSETKKMMLIK